MFYSYTYDISLLILVILMAEKEMMIASKSLFKKRKKKRYHILKKKKKKKLAIYKDFQGRQQKFILNVETVHVKRVFKRVLSNWNTERKIKSVLTPSLYEPLLLF